MAKQKLSRRRFVASTAAASAALIAAPYVRGAHAAGKLSIGFWDHWVPGANKATEALVNEWAAKEKVEVQMDFIPSQGNKLLLTIAAESQAKSGHDIIAMSTWLPAEHARNLEPVDDIMAELLKQNGNVNDTVEYLGKINGSWVAVPATVGSQIKGPCSRIDLMKQHAGIDVQALYPAGAPANADSWTLDVFLRAAEACHKAGVPFGIGLGTTPDNVDTAGAIFHSFGAVLVDKDAKITVKSDPVREALDYYKKLTQFLPADAPAWDDASNNKWLVAGKGALIMNPPSAWAVAKRDAPKVAEQCWTHGMPAGPKGRFAPFLHYFWAHLELQQEQVGGQEPAGAPFHPHRGREDGGGQWRLRYSVVREADHDFKTWAEEGPPKGTLYHYPNPHNHQILSVAAAPAPHKIAVQIYVQALMTKMVVRHLQGEAMEKTLAWAESELEGFMRS